MLLAGCGCGYVADPKPPALEIPQTVTDLRAVQYGARVLADFTLPALTTEGLGLENVRSIELRATSGTEVRGYSVPPQEPGAVQYEFPSSDWTGKGIVLAVRAIGPKGKASEWSNQVSLAIGEPLAVPEALGVLGSAEGVLMAWRGVGSGRYRILRAAGDAAPVRIAETDKAEYIDREAAIGTSYRYFVQSIDGESRQSELSAPVAITPKDSFPPAVPAGLSAIFSNGAMDLAWQRNTEADFASYRIYRAESLGDFSRIADDIAVPAYSDSTVEMGKRYRYAISSVDQTGNESARSEVAEAVAH